MRLTIAYSARSDWTGSTRVARIALADELALLRRARFTLVDVPWRRQAFAVIAAVR